MTSRAGYWIGGGVVVLGVVVAILWGVLGFARLAATIDGFQRVEIPGSGPVELQAGRYVVYVEGPGVEEEPRGVRVQITDQRTERPLSLQAYGGSLTYDVSRSSGAALATVSIPRAGTYRVLTAGAPAGAGFELAIGQSIGRALLTAILGAVLLGAILGGAGVVLVIVTAVRRSRGRGAQDPTGAAAAP